MKSVGVLIEFTDAHGRQAFGVVNPEHPYIMLRPEETPDDMLPVIKQLTESEGYTPLGVLVDPEVDTA